MVSRNTGPPQALVEKLIDLMEVKTNLATGHARTAVARARMRAEWAEVAKILNSDDTGCVRSWNQWAKYWKDKKAAVKRKANLMEAAAEEVELSDIEKRILAITREGLESNTSNDGGLSMQDEDEMVSPHKVFLEKAARESESPPASDVRSSDEDCKQRLLFVATPQQRRQLLMSSQGLNGDSSQRRHDVHRTRRLRRSPPSQRRSPPSQRRSAQRHFEMASLNYRSAAIEERRIEAELAIARSTEMLAHGHRVMAAAIDNLTNTVTLVAQQMIEVIQNNRAPNI